MLSSVVCLPRENLNEPWASSRGSPMADKTWDGFRFEDVQAEPVEQAMPSISSFRSMDSPSTYENEILTLFGSLCEG
jgi:hypothetical protein